VLVRLGGPRGFVRHRNGGDPGWFSRTKLKEEMGKLAVYEKQMLASPDQQISLTDPDSRSMA
jgi:hypothetical protein